MQSGVGIQGVQGVSDTGLFFKAVRYPQHINTIVKVSFFFFSTLMNKIHCDFQCLLTK
jgi:hypothetical protein